MSISAETIESLLYRSNAAFDQLDPTTWVIELDNDHKSKVVLKIADPIVLFSVPFGALGEQLDQRERLYETLLGLNADLMHTSYTLDAGKLVLSGALQLENLDTNEFQAVLDDIAMNLDHHLEQLSDWGLDAKPTTEA